MSDRIDALFKMLVVLARDAATRAQPLDSMWPYEAKRGDLVVETSSLRGPDPDAIGWLVGEGQAPWGADDGEDAPMRHVWDIVPLNPAAVLEHDRGVQRWENATFRVVPPSFAERAGLVCPIESLPSGNRT